MKRLSHIKQFLIQCVSLLSNAKDSIKWSASLNSSPEPQMVGNKMPADGTSLILAPHADDELIGCYNYIRYHPDSVVLYCGLLGSNYTKENEILRKKEFISFCEYIGVQYRISDGVLKEDIKRIIDEVQPANLLIPSFIDWHQEHRLMSEICFDLSNKLVNSNVIWYRISVPIMAYNYSINESKNEFKEKWESFNQCYVSQKCINTRRFKFVERHCISNSFAAELFYIQTIMDFKDNYERLVNKTALLEDLKCYLSNYKELVIKSELPYHLIQNK